MKQVEHLIKERKVGKAQYDIEEMCSQLVALHFIDKIEMTIPPRKFVTQRYTSYQGTKDPVAHVLPFKHSIAQIQLHINLKDAILCQTFISTLQDNAQSDSMISFHRETQVLEN